MDSLEIHNRSQVPPFQVNADDDVDENLRLEYRYLDLRRPRMQRNLRTRHRIVKAMRDFFDSRDFLEIETPMLIKSTPEGARDYLVPSRLYPGHVLRAAAVAAAAQADPDDRGLRTLHADRALHARRGSARRPPVEFVQLDVEMSFCTEDDVLEMMESCMRHVWRTVLGVELAPFPRLTHREAIAPLRPRQARSALRPRARRRRRGVRRHGVRRVPLGARVGRRGGRRCGYPGRRGALAARLRRAHGDREAVRREGDGVDRARRRRHQIAGREVPDRRAHRGRADGARRGDRRRAAALRGRDRARVRRCRQDAQRGRRALRAARSQHLCVRVGHRLSVSRDRRGDRREDAGAPSVYGAGARRLGPDRPRRRWRCARSTTIWCSTATSSARDRSASTRRTSSARSSRCSGSRPSRSRSGSDSSCGRSSTARRRTAAWRSASIAS